MNSPISVNPRGIVVAARLSAALLALSTLCLTSAGAQTDGAIVRGRIADAAGMPLVGFPVLVVDSSGRTLPLRTGKDGRFQTIGLTAGQVVIQLDAQDYETGDVRCRIPSGRTAFVELFASVGRGAKVPAARCRLEPTTSDSYGID